MKGLLSGLPGLARLAAIGCMLWAAVAIYAQSGADYDDDPIVQFRRGLADPQRYALRSRDGEIDAELLDRSIADFVGDNLAYLAERFRQSVDEMEPAAALPDESRYESVCELTHEHLQTAGQALRTLYAALPDCRRLVMVTVAMFLPVAISEKDVMTMPEFARWISFFPSPCPTGASWRRETIRWS